MTKHWKPRSLRRSPILLNGSAREGALPQVFEPKQHGQRAFELAVQMNLVSSEPFQFVGVERLTERLLADQGPVGQFLLVRHVAL